MATASVFASSSGGHRGAVLIKRVWSQSTAMTAGAMRRWLAVVLAIGQIVSSAVVFGFGLGNLGGGGTSEATITPAGYAFAIWSIPILGCLTWAVFTVRRTIGDQVAYRSVAWPLNLAMAGFSWL